MDLRKHVADICAVTLPSIEALPIRGDSNANAQHQP
jgi:hypothetical protein